jgi:hypothetical protein
VQLGVIRTHVLPGVLASRGRTVVVSTDGHKTMVLGPVPVFSEEPSDLRTLVPRHTLGSHLYNHIQKHHSDSVQVCQRCMQALARRVLW